MAVGKLPRWVILHHAPKWFAAVEMIRLVTNQDWLQKAAKEITKHWKNKRQRLLDSRQI
jgi:hypothetical protein